MSQEYLKDGNDVHEDVLISCVSLQETILEWNVVMVVVVVVDVMFVYAFQEKENEHKFGWV